MKNSSKKELKIVFNAEIYDELKFVFRPDQLGNIIYKPEILGEKKWQCCCGSESELEICPICGMEKNTVLSKVNANYLAHHRKVRLARKRKAMQDQQAMMAAQIIKKNKKNNKPNNKKLGTVLGVLILCIAVVACVVIVLNGNESKIPTIKPVDTTVTTSVETTKAPEKTDDKKDETTKKKEETTTPPTTETTAPETTLTEVISVPSEQSNKNPATLADGTWFNGASGNTSVGSLVFSGEKYDFVCADGLKILKKDGTKEATITEKKVLGVTAKGDNVFYIDESNLVHKYNIKSKKDTTFAIKAKQICEAFGELYYTSNEETGLFACNFNGQKIKNVSSLEIFAISKTADKLYFSTSESLAVITSKDSKVITFCKDGAKATSILEMTGYVFYTSVDGKVKFFYPQKTVGYGTEYPIYNVDITHISAFENRVYIKTVNPYTKAVKWYVTTWTAGTKLFTPANFTYIGISSDSLYVSNNAIFDGALNRKPIA